MMAADTREASAVVAPPGMDMSEWTGETNLQPSTANKRIEAGRRFNDDTVECTVSANSVPK